MVKRILLLEDDAALGQGIQLALQLADAQITLCSSLLQARQLLSGAAFDLLILDVNLPDGSGLELLREQKALRPEIPAILLTANDLELDEVAGLESGADDYITKPFSLAVLRARVNAQLRRSAAAGSAALALGAYTFDFERMVYRKNGASIELEPRRTAAAARVGGKPRACREPRRAGGSRVDGRREICAIKNALTVTVRRLRAPSWRTIRRRRAA